MQLFGAVSRSASCHLLEAMAVDLLAGLVYAKWSKFGLLPCMEIAFETWVSILKEQKDLWKILAEAMI
jgi:uncharacterized membrane protein